MLAVSVFLPGPAALADVGNVAFRPLLVKGELEGKKFDTLANGDNPIFIWKLRYICERDISKAEMFSSATNRGRLLVGFTLNEDGAKRLRHFTKKFGARHLAIFAGKMFINTIPAIPPTFIGNKIVVRWPGTEKDLRELVININRKPPSVIALYIEEQGKYNEYAADAWANLYTEINDKIREDRRKHAEAMAIASEAGD
jgi:hypothetical protein